jgi:hypothetical protein
MTSTAALLIPIECLPGVDTDNTDLTAKLYTWSEKIRFVRNLPQKIGGWEEFLFNNNAMIDGVARSIFSASLSGRVYTVIGTNTKLYSVLGSELTNITPLDVDTIAIANSLDTHYGLLATDPLATENGSNVITVTDAEAARFQVNDEVTLSGATGFNGILAGALNAVHIIRSVTATTYTFRVGTNANATGSGGGAAVLRRSGLITVDDTAHEQEDGDRVKITGAADTGGILAAEINLEFIIRNVTANTFDIITDGVATSSVSNGGGASTEYQQEIPPGPENESLGQGYGMGMYGVGLYGVSKLSTNVRVIPRIWFFDRYGELITMTPGNQTGVYQWDGDLSVAPVLVPNAPDEVNYQFISDNILVTFGAGGVDNKIFASDQGDIEEWTASSTNQVFEDIIEGAGRLLSHVAVNGLNLIFTENKTYLFSYIGLPNVWSIQLKEQNIGIISPMARVSVNGTAYWMDDGNFYKWSGGNIDVIPSNISTQSTVHNWMYGDLNYGQKSKTFAWYNPLFNEIWFHSLSSNSNEPDKLARLNIIDLTWVPDLFDRTAAEYPNISLSNPRLINAGELYKHEMGYNAAGEPMYWELQGNLRSLGRDFANVDGIIPDSIQNGTIQLNITGKRFPQSQANTAFKNLDIEPETERVPFTTNEGYWKYTWSGEVLDQFFRYGTWAEYVQKAGKN